MKIAQVTKKKPLIVPIILGLMLITVQFAAAQDNGRLQYQRIFQSGTQLYRQSRMHEAAAEFRRAQETAGNTSDWAQALYWVILAELALGDLGSAIRDMDDLEKYAPNSGYTTEMIYHRARVYFNLGYFENALMLFQRYTDNILAEDTESTDRKAAAFFWMGECLYSMRQFDEAEKFYAWVITKYRESPKVEVSSYRLDLIKQKKIEAELLELLRWSHEESLRTSEEYQRRIRTYEHTLNIYQRRIAELTEGGGFGGILPSGQTEAEILNNILQDLQSEEITDDNELSYTHSSDADLIDRARQIGMNIQRLIYDHEQELISRGYR